MARAPLGLRAWAAGAAILASLVTGTASPAGAGALETQGRRLYREGLLSSGAPLTAVVEGDVPVRGPQLTCLGCHQRSGLGSAEGPATVPPVSGPALFAPGEGAHRRPAYTEETLARAIRDGVDAAGRRLDPLMPRYRLGDADTRALVAYLKTLSAERSPGVTDETVRMATIVSDGVDPGARAAMLQILETFFREKNGETRLEPRRAQVRSSRTANRAYRKWLLSVWTLHGPSGTWNAQLDAYYRREPVFAVLAGIAAGPWRPVHDFCERNEIPCLLPNTDLPVIAPQDFYTLYFSKGVVLEAQALAAHLSHPAAGGHVLQVFRRDGTGDAAADALRQALGAHASVSDLPLPVDGHVAAETLARRVTETRATAVVLWLPAGELGQLGGWTRGRTPLYLSSTQLGAPIASVPRELRAGTFVVHPFALPGERAAGLARLQAWLRSRGIALVDERIQAQTYFACLVAGDGLMHVSWLLHRDYFLDALDHISGLAGLSAWYPRLGFGPRQRYLAKGSYLLTLGGEGPDAIVTDASWLTVGG